MTKADAYMQEPPFELGKIYDRREDIHAQFKGQQQGGISTPSDSLFIFLFTGDTGEQYGYKDDWTKEGVFLYTGEGQTGDMDFIRGNKAIRDHAADGKDLLLFEAVGKRKGVRFKGQFACASWETRTGPDKEGNPRKIIVFHLVPVEETPTEAIQIASAPIDELRRQAYAASRDVAEKSPSEGRRSYYERSAEVRAYVLARAAGVCEACRKPAPFLRSDGSVYLEPHHTRRVSDGGPDDPRWVAGICPNCHKKIHHGRDGERLNRKVQDYVETVENR
jgi:5-methylcytosine-specific restriction enzyme A